MRLHRRAVLGATVGLASACATSADPHAAWVTIEAHVPVGTGPVYVAGSLPALGAWRADGARMAGDGAVRTLRLRLRPGEALEYKFTLGSWENEGLGPSGTVMPNFSLTAAPGARVTHAIPAFRRDARALLQDMTGSGILGRLDVWIDVASARLEQSRHVTIWTPPGYTDDPNTRYRVIYAHDGQNLFDPRIANTGSDWGMDEAMVRLTQAGAIEPAIVVGVWSTPQRRREYAPAAFVSALPEAEREGLLKELGGAPLSDSYIDFLAREIKPRVDAAYRTRPGPADTFALGSSMGGLISLAMTTRAPETFGGAACLSIHWPVSVDHARIADAAANWRPVALAAHKAALAGRLDPARQKLWIDIGTLNLDSLYPPYQDAMTPVLRDAGFGPDRLAMPTYPGADHNEAAWRARLDDPLRFLLGT